MFVCAVRPADPGEVGPHRSVEAAADPRSGAWRTCAFWVVKTLVRSQPAGPVRRVAALHAVPEGAGREGRAGRRDLLPQRAGVHRSAHHRRRHGHPQGLVLQRLPGPRRRDPDRPGHARQRRVHRREDRARHRHVDGRRGAARPHLVAAQRAAVPAGERWHGSSGSSRPRSNYRTVDAGAAAARLRKVGYYIVAAADHVLCIVPLAIGGAVHAAAPRSRSSTAASGRRRAGASRPGRSTSTPWSLSVVLFFGVDRSSASLVVGTVPRLLNLAITPGQGLSAVRLPLLGAPGDRAADQLKFFTQAVRRQLLHRPLPACLGYDLSPVVQTGSNFGTAVKHENPYLSRSAAERWSPTGCRSSTPTTPARPSGCPGCRSGAHNFLGNHIAYPAQAGRVTTACSRRRSWSRSTGKVREGVGLLGSPSFEIPRSVERDSSFDDLKTATSCAAAWRAKNRHNLVTMACYLLVAVVLLLPGHAARLGRRRPLRRRSARRRSRWRIVLVAAASPSSTTCSSSAPSTAFQPLTPLFCSIYDPHFWRHERFWKVPSDAYFELFDGTPFKNVIWRLLGVRIGRRVFDDGCYHDRSGPWSPSVTTARSTPAASSSATPRRTAPSSPTAPRIGAGCTLGVGAFVHYGVTIGDGAVLAADSFLMKGEEVPRRTPWGGNPAAEMPDPAESRTGRIRRMTTVGVTAVVIVGSLGASGPGVPANGRVGRRDVGDDARRRTSTGAGHVSQRGRRQRPSHRRRRATRQRRLMVS